MASPALEQIYGGLDKNARVVIGERALGRKELVQEILA